MPLSQASESIIRLDEKLAHSKVRDGVVHRLLYTEACACQYAEGDLVHLDELIMLDGLVFTGKPAASLSSALYTLCNWRRAHNGNAAEMRLLAELGAEVNVVDEVIGKTPLMMLAAELQWDERRESPAEPERALREHRRTLHRVGPARCHRLPRPRQADVGQQKHALHQQRRSQ